MRLLEPGRVGLMATVALFMYPGAMAGQETSRTAGTTPSRGSGWTAPVGVAPSDTSGLRLKDIADVVYEEPTLTYGRTLNREPAKLWMLATPSVRFRSRRSVALRYFSTSTDL